MGKVAIPNWAEPIKKMLRNQAVARERVATVKFRMFHQPARSNDGTLDTEDRNPQVGPSKLHVVNPGDSAFTNTTESSFPTQTQPTSPSTPRKPAKGNGSRLDYEPQRSYFGPVHEVSEKSDHDQHTEKAPSSEGTIRLRNSMEIIDIPDDISVSDADAIDGHSTITSPSQISNQLSISSSRGWMNTAAGLKLLSGYGIPPSTPEPPESHIGHMAYPSPIPEDGPAPPSKRRVEEPISPPRPIIEPSIATLDRAASAKIYFENLYFPILRHPPSREQRRLALERDLDQMVHLTNVQKDEIRHRWRQNETDYLREKRQRVSAEAFRRLKVIGHGAFGIVTLVREKSTGKLYAMKQVHFSYPHQCVLRSLNPVAS